MREVSARVQRDSAAGKRPGRRPLDDDWLGEISDDDWSEEAAESADQQRAPVARHERRAPESETERDGFVGGPEPARPVSMPTELRRAAVQRRRAVAALALLLLVGLAGTGLALLLRDGAEAPATTAPESQTVTTTAVTETDPAPTSTPSPAPVTTPTEPSETFTLPEGTKLQRGEASGESNLTVSTDAELIAELQRALARAGYDPGAPDGTFGLLTEEAVVAFQQANGLSPDGIVGPETADALSRALARG